MSWRFISTARFTWCWLCLVAAGFCSGGVAKAVTLTGVPVGQGKFYAMSGTTGTLAAAAMAVRGSPWVTAGMIGLQLYHAYLLDSKFQTKDSNPAVGGFTKPSSSGTGVWKWTRNSNTGYANTVEGACGFCTSGVLCDWTNQIPTLTGTSGTLSGTSTNISCSYSYMQVGSGGPYNWTATLTGTQLTLTDCPSGYVSVNNNCYMLRPNGVAEFQNDGTKWMGRPDQTTQSAKVGSGYAEIEWGGTNSDGDAVREKVTATSDGGLQFDQWHEMPSTTTAPTESNPAPKDVRHQSVRTNSKGVITQVTNQTYNNNNLNSVVNSTSPSSSSTPIQLPNDYAREPTLQAIRDWLVNRSATAGNRDCVTAPTCTGDAIACAMMSQAWNQSCAWKDAPPTDQVAKSETNVDSLVGTLSRTRFSAGVSCPPDITVNTVVLGLVTIPMQPACDQAALIRPVVISLGVILAAFVVMGAREIG